MTEKRISATTTVNAAIDTVFAVLADPSTHQAIDGTGWVREALETGPVTAVGQIFRCAMYHENHPLGHYEMANRVEVFEPPHAIAWLPGQGPQERGNMMAADERVFGGWIWRYDLRPLGPRSTEVELSYDWSGVGPEQLNLVEFPPFDPQHLDNSLKNLAALAESRSGEKPS